MVVFIFFSIIPIETQYIPHDIIVASIFFSIIPTGRLRSVPALIMAKPAVVQGSTSHGESWLRASRLGFRVQGLGFRA